MTPEQWRRLDGAERDYSELPDLDVMYTCLEDLLFTHRRALIDAVRPKCPCAMRAYTYITRRGEVVEGTYLPIANCPDCKGTGWAT